MKRLIPIALSLLLCLPLKAQTDSVRIGIALCGGAARGYVHIGVLQAIDEAGLELDVVSGTSMGAIIGLFYSAGYTPMEILDMVKRHRMDHTKHIVRNNRKRDAGFADYAFLRRIIYRYMPHNHFDSLQTQFYCCVTDLNRGKSSYIGHGPLLAQYVTASASVPFLFSPVIIEGTTYVDGCVLNDIPIEPLLMEHCDITLGSYLLQDTIAGRFDKRNEIWSRIVSLYMSSNIIDRLPLFDYLIPNDLHGLEAFDFDKVDALVGYGYEAAKAVLRDTPELRKLCSTPFPEPQRRKRPEE